VIGDALLLDLTPIEEEALIDVAELEQAAQRLARKGATVLNGDIILLRTDWAQRKIGTPEYCRQSPGLTQPAAQWLLDQKPKAMACDFFEEPAARQPGWTADQFVVHRAILGAGILLVEGLVNLRDLSPRCQFFAPFYHLAGFD